MGNLRNMLIRFAIFAILIPLGLVFLLNSVSENKNIEPLTVLAVNSREEIFTEHIKFNIPITTYQYDPNDPDLQGKAFDYVYFNNEYTASLYEGKYSALAKKTFESPLVLYVPDSFFSSNIDDIHENVWISEYGSTQYSVSFNKLYEILSTTDTKLRYPDIYTSAEGPAFLSLLTDYFTEEDDMTAFLLGNPSVKVKNLFGNTQDNEFILSRYLGDQYGYNIIYLSPTYTVKQTLVATSERGVKYLDNMSSYLDETFSSEYVDSNVVNLDLVKNFLKFKEDLNLAIVLSEYDDSCSLCLRFCIIFICIIPTVISIEVSRSIEMSCYFVESLVLCLFSYFWLIIILNILALILIMRFDDNEYYYDLNNIANSLGHLFENKKEQIAKKAEEKKRKKEAQKNAETIANSVGKENQVRYTELLFEIEKMKKISKDFCR